MRIASYHGVLQRIMTCPSIAHTIRSQNVHDTSCSVLGSRACVVRVSSVCVCVRSACVRPVGRREPRRTTNFPLQSTTVHSAPPCPKETAGRVLSSSITTRPEKFVFICKRRFGGAQEKNWEILRLRFHIKKNLRCSSSIPFKRIQGKRSL